MFRRFVLTLVGAVALWLGALPAGAQQNLMGIVAVVNDQVISAYDVQARVHLSLVSAGFPDTQEVRDQLQPQVLRLLIEEVLKSQEMTRQGITVSEAQIEAAMAGIERRNGMAKGDLLKKLSGAGVDLDDYRQQLRVAIGWGQVINQAAHAEPPISQADIDDKVAEETEKANHTQYLLSEILVLVDKPSDDGEARELVAKLIGQLRNGVSFPQLAQQFSQSPTAAVGGDMGWVSADALEDASAAVVQQMTPGQVSVPLRTADGYLLLALREKRQPGGQLGPDANLVLSQVVLPAANGAAKSKVDQAAAALSKAMANVRGCDQFDAVGSKLDSPLSGRIGQVRLGDLPVDLQGVVTSLGVGVPSKVLRIANGVQVLMVCARDEPVGESDAARRQRVQEALELERLHRTDTRLMRQLKRSALVENRS